MGYQKAFLYYCGRISFRAAEGGRGPSPADGGGDGGVPDLGEAGVGPPPAAAAAAAAPAPPVLPPQPPHGHTAVGDVPRRRRVPSPSPAAAGAGAGRAAVAVCK